MSIPAPSSMPFWLKTHTLCALVRIDLWSIIARTRFDKMPLASCVSTLSCSR